MKTLTNSNEMSLTSTKLAQPLNVMAQATTGGRDVNVSKRSVLRMVSGSLGLLLAAQMFVACQPKSGDRSAGGAPATSAPVLGAAGTGDTAGGDGVRNAVFEADAVDVTKTPEWINHIAPIEKHLDEISKATPDGQGGYSAFARKKTWFIAKVTLDQIEKKNLGVDFIKDPIQQLALQDDQSIWIDKVKYEDPKNTERDRAFLLMHETVVSIYLLRFLPPRELCLLFSGSQAGNCELFEVLFGPATEPKRKLVENDYKHIRAMTEWLMNQGPSVKDHKEVLVEYIRHGFDPRIFKLDDATKSTPTREMKVVEATSLGLDQSLASAKILHRLPTNCSHNVPMTLNGKCQVDVELTRIAGLSRMVKMSFMIEANGVSQLFVAYQLFSDNDDKTSMVSSPRPLNRSEYGNYQYFGIAMPVVDHLVVGQKVYEVSIVWAEYEQTVTDIILQERIVTEINKDRVRKESLGYFGQETDFRYGTAAKSVRKDVIISSDSATSEKDPYNPGASSGTHVVMRNPQPLKP